MTFKVVAHEPKFYSSPMEKATCDSTVSQSVVLNSKSKNELHHIDFTLQPKIEDNEVTVNGIVFGFDTRYIGHMSKLAHTCNYFAYNKAAQAMFATKPYRKTGDQTYEVVWIDKNYIYGCKFKCLSNHTFPVLVYPKSPLRSKLTHSWLVWVGDIALLMNVSVHYTWQTDTDSSYIKTLEKYSNTNKVIVGVVEISENMQSRAQSFYRSTCSYITPCLPCNRIMYVGKFHVNGINFYRVLM